MLQGLVSSADAAEVEQFCAAQPELAFWAISNSLDVPTLCTIKPDKDIVQLGMLLLVVGALPDTEVDADQLPQELPASLPDTFRHKVVASVLKAARSHAARSTAARA